MPELPDVVVYIEALERRIFGQTLQRIRLASPFLLRSVDPPLSEAYRKKVLGLRRLGKRIVYAENETNYCTRCQTGGKLLADRALSRLLKEDWPRTLEEMEETRGQIRYSK
jgi:hypothetical protein